MTGFDQVISSLSNFAAGVAVARVAGIAALGEYGLAYATWLVLVALHRSLITDPMAIENDVNQPDAAGHVRAGLAAEFVLGAASFVIFGLVGLVLLSFGQRGYGIAFVTFAPWLPFLLAQDYWRWVAFMKSKPGKALANDAVFDAVQVAAFVLLVVAGERSSVLAIVAWGSGSVAGALFGLWQFSTRPTLRGGLQRLKARWGLSKWLTATSAASYGASQAVTVLSAAILGPVGFGGLRAAYSLVSGPTNVLIQAGGSIGLPESARAVRARGWAGLRRVQRLLTFAGVMSVGPIVVVVLLFGKQLLGGIYGHQFSRYASTADLLALGCLVSTLRLGAILSMKATRQTRSLYLTSLVSLVVSLGFAAVLVPLFGVVGAGWASLCSTAVIAMTQLVLHWRLSPPAAQRMLFEPEPAANGDGHQAGVVEAQPFTEKGMLVPEERSGAWGAEMADEQTAKGVAASRWLTYRLRSASWWVLRRPVLGSPVRRLSHSIAGASRWSPFRLFVPLRSKLKGEMDAERALDILATLERSGTRCWVAGGWGVDALIGVQTRRHDDLDVIVDDFERRAPEACRALATIGFAVVERNKQPFWMPDQWTLKDAADRRIDLVSLDWNRIDRAQQDGSDDLASPFFVHGSIGGRRVPCLSAGAQQLLHSGLAFRRTDRRDLLHLAESGATGDAEHAPIL